MDVIERLAMVIGSNVSAVQTRKKSFHVLSFVLFVNRLFTLLCLKQGIIMKADIEGEIRVKCYLPNCSGECHCGC